MLRAAFIVLLIALLPSHARAEAKIALLIGNEDYGSEIGRLAPPYFASQYGVSLVSSTSHSSSEGQADASIRLSSG
jgi:hypothetical protein